MAGHVPSQRGAYCLVKKQFRKQCEDPCKIWLMVGIANKVPFELCFLLISNSSQIQLLSLNNNNNTFQLHHKSLKLSKVMKHLTSYRGFRDRLRYSLNFEDLQLGQKHYRFKIQSSYSVTVCGIRFLALTTCARTGKI